MRVGLVYLRPKQVVFIRTTGPYRSSSLLAWAAMADWLDRHGLRAHMPCGYGLAQDDPQTVAAELCRYDACIELPAGVQIPRDDGLPIQTLPGGAFARVRHVGPYRSVRTSITRVRDDWMPLQSGLLHDRRRPLLTIYLDDPRTKDLAKLRCDVCLPVRTDHDDVFRRTRFTATHAA